ncbi:MAG: ribbon-helix-helix protein, CopG family [Bdellovibrionales bacterium]|nr:ribbon-helix-helix protein, CopG family [Bdellovibrionales bacterium]
MDETITLRIPIEMREALEEICDSEGVSMSVVVRDALKKLISTHKHEELRKEILPYAEKAGFYSDEDILDIPS